MQKLYLDCDGVILDTIAYSYKYFKENNIEENSDKDANKRKEYYKSLVWDDFIKEAGEIDNATAKIKKLLDSGLFDIKILTHVNSDSEAKAKKKYFSKKLPGVETICVPKEIKKSDYVDPKNTILVDDYIGNLDCWFEKGGIPIKFSNAGKKSKYKSVTNLLELLDITIEKEVKL